MIRVAFVSDQPLSALGLWALFNSQHDLELVRAFTSKDFVLDEIEQLALDILILDCYLLSNPSENIIRQIKNAKMTIPIFALNQIVDEQHFLTLMDAGVSGYLLTREPVDILLEAIFEVANDGFRVSSLLEAFLANNQPSAKDLLRHFTEREREVLTLVVEGYHNHQISERLHISMGTVKNHLKSIYKKLNVHTRVEAVLVALKHGLVELN